MNERTLYHCNLLIENRDTIASLYKWESGLTHLCCSGIFTMKGIKVDVGTLMQAKVLLKQQSSIFSEFRGMASPVVASMLSISENPKLLLAQCRTVYDLLKKKFQSCPYLPITAMVIAQTAAPDTYEQVVSRAHGLYKMMKKAHPFLTSSDDYTFCALMALSEKRDDTLIADAEACFAQLKGNGMSRNGIQSLSHVLSLYDGSPMIKCQQTLDLYQKIKEQGIHFGTSYELPILGILAMSGQNLTEIAANIAEIDGWLKQQKGFGLFGSVNTKQRLMYAALLAQPETQASYVTDSEKQELFSDAGATTATLATLIAQEAAMCAAMMASASAAAATSSSSN